MEEEKGYGLQSKLVMFIQLHTSVLNLDTVLQNGVFLSLEREYIIEFLERSYTFLTIEKAMNRLKASEGHLIALQGNVSFSLNHPLNSKLIYIALKIYECTPTTNGFIKK